LEIERERDQPAARGLQRREGRDQKEGRNEGRKEGRKHNIFNQRADSIESPLTELKKEFNYRAHAARMHMYRKK